MRTTTPEKKAFLPDSTVARETICFVVGNKGSAGVKNLVKRGLWSRLVLVGKTHAPYVSVSVC